MRMTISTIVLASFLVLAAPVYADDASTDATGDEAADPADPQPPAEPSEPDEDAEGKSE